MGQYQNIGDKVSLSGGPRNMEPKNQPQDGAVQCTGDKAPLKQTPIPNNITGAGVKDGQKQNIGDKAPLNMTPHRGYENSSTPMSERSSKQGPGRG
ncbi:MAG: hypothetical protein HC888_12205 [Candidatus Competibacteraceae bacterium]|nr:hypothetical protein [Candidatus Competibacteraceae bacterium]